MGPQYRLPFGKALAAESWTIRMTDPKDRDEFCYLDVTPTGHLGIRIPKALHVLEMNLRLDLARLEAFANRGRFQFPN